MLELKHINYAVEDGEGNQKFILNDINLTINNNDIVVITGHNGSGKSTLMKVIMGILPATSGQILFEGVDITNMTISDRAKLGIAYAFQTPVRFKGLKVRDLLTTAQKNNSQITDVCHYLSKVGLCARDYIDRELDDSLSGGELKRIEIATTLTRGAKLNMFDEPEAGIDLWSFEGLISAFKDNKENGGTNIIISHQEKLIDIADKILVMKNGSIDKFGEKKDIIDSLNNTQVCAKLQGGKYE